MGDVFYILEMQRIPERFLLQARKRYRSNRFHRPPSNTAAILLHGHQCTVLYRRMRSELPCYGAHLT